MLTQLFEPISLSIMLDNEVYAFVLGFAGPATADNDPLNEKEVRINVEVSAVPLPAAAPLMLGGLALMTAVARRRSRG